MWLMLQQDEADDYIVATGKTYSLEEMVETVFSSLGLHWRDHVELNPDLLRPTDIKISLADPGKAERELSWKAKYGMKEVAAMMVKACMERIVK
jgi:GDPmannose 4,6-dehydratase